MNGRGYQVQSADRRRLRVYARVLRLAVLLVDAEAARRRGGRRRRRRHHDLVAVAAAADDRRRGRRCRHHRCQQHSQHHRAASHRAARRRWCPAGQHEHPQGTAGTAARQGRADR